MEKRLLILAILITCTYTIYAQTKVSGKVVDNNRLAIEGVTVLILNKNDSSYIAGTITNADGNYAFPTTPQNSYILSFSMIGYKKVYIESPIRKKTESIVENIILEEDAYILSELVVTGNIPHFSINAGKTIINLSSSLLNTDTNILDALKKLPGVIIQNDGIVILNGQSGTNVMIDDKLTYLSGENLINLLRSTPVNSVDKIELISHPSSKYDAAGNSGIINIQLKKTTIQGTNITMSSTLEGGKYVRGGENISLNIRHNALNIYADYSFYWGKDFLDVVSPRFYLDPFTTSSTQLRQDYTANRKTQYNSHYAKTGIDYNPTDQLAIGTYVTYNWLNRKRNDYSTSEFFSTNPQSDSTLVTTNGIDYYNNNLRGGTNITYKWKEKGKWDSSFDFQLFKQKDDLMQNNRFQIPTIEIGMDTLAGKTKGNINIYSGQSNLNYSISDKFSFAIGLKSSFIQINSEALYKYPIKSKWQTDHKNSSSFIYDENINAGYFQLNANWSPKLSTEIGLRTENTNIKNRNITNQGDSTIHDNYINIFPTLTTQYHISDNHSFTFLYGRRIVRPNYRDLNPFVEINDRFLYEKGNTELKPELIDNFELSWIFKKQYALNLFYSNRKNPITKSYLVENNSIILVMPLNLSVSHTCGVRLGLNNLSPFKWWTSHINASFIYKQFQWIMSEELNKNKQITPTIHLNNCFSLPLGWSLETNGYYNGKMVEGQAIIHPIWTVSVGARKKLFNNKCSIYIYANDIFQSERAYIDLNSYYIKGWYKELRDNRMLGITFSYRFNSGSGTKDSRRENRIDESKRINL